MEKIRVQLSSQPINMLFSCFFSSNNAGNTLDLATGIFFDREWNETRAFKQCKKSGIWQNNMMCKKQGSLSYI